MLQAHGQVIEHVAVEAEKPPTLTHPPAAPGEREVFPPTKVGGIPDWPWHDVNTRPVPPTPPLSQGGLDYVFVAQVNLEQLRDCAFITPGLLPTTGVLYFFVQIRKFFVQIGEEFFPDDEITSQVMHYDPTPDAPPWPATLPHAAFEDPVHRQLLAETFGIMADSFEDYSSSVPAPAADCLTLPPFAKHQLIDDAWPRRVANNVLSEERGEEVLSEDSSVNSDWLEEVQWDANWEAESKYMTDARDLGPPCTAPMMLGHCVIPKEVVDAWWKNGNEEGIEECPIGEKINAGQVCLLQLTMGGTFVAFFASEKELRERRWDAVQVAVMHGE